MDSVLARFFSHVAVGDCWEWTASLTEGGYGQFFVGSRRHRAHRWLWTRLVGPLDRSIELDHRCRNRRCVNPDHLEPVTNRINQRRGESPTGRNSRRAECVNRHPFTADNTYIAKGRNGATYRQCRACNRDRHRASRQNREDAPRG